MPNIKPKSLLYLSDDRVLYVGRLETVLDQIGAVSTFLVSVDKELDLICHHNNQSYSSRSFLIPAGMEVSIITHDSIVALCFLDALGTDFAKLIPKMTQTIDYGNRGRIYAGMSRESNVIKRAHFVLDSRPSAKTAFKQLEEWIGTPYPETNIVVDERVTKAISLIKEHSADNLSVAEIAKKINLSVPRLIQLFKKVTGTSIRRFRLWHRIYRTSLKLGQGYSLTEASLKAGFSDYAHFSRVYRKIGGASPVDMKNNTEIRILKSTKHW